MQGPDWFDLFERIAPPAIGSGAALHWLPGTWGRKAWLFITGLSFAFWGGPYLSMRTEIPESVAGLLIGLFSMTIVDKLMTEFRQWPAGQWLDTVFSRVLDKFFPTRR